MKTISTKTKIISLTVLWVFTLCGSVGAYFALKIPTNYSMDQFLPKRHSLLTWEYQSKKVFQISESAPHILLLSNKAGDGFWYDQKHLKGLETLTNQIQGLKGVKSVFSLGNIRSAFENKNELLVGTLLDLQKQGFKTEQILKDPLYTPNLISKDGRLTALFVLPHDLSQNRHENLIKQLNVIAQKAFPKARVQIGGPAAIRTQLISLLSSEIATFIFLSLIAAMCVLKIMFHGWGVMPQLMFVLVMANMLTLGLMGYFKMSFNVLSSTLPIIVTISSLGIATHTLVRMSEGAHLDHAGRLRFLRELMRELIGPHLMTAFCVSVGFATLIPSSVPIISEYGKVVSAGVLVSAFTTLSMLPALYVWVAWPAPRDFLSPSEKFAYFIVRFKNYLIWGIGTAVVTLFFVGLSPSWTAKLFDDLPSRNPASRSTELIGRKLGGVASVDFMVGSRKIKSTWKQPQNIRKLKELADSWRKSAKIGSVLTMADFLATGENKSLLPQKREAIAELQFLYSMSGESPLKQYISNDEKWTRIAVRLPDLPADQNAAVVRKMERQIKAKFPGLQVRASGLGVVVPTVNNEIAKHLMWGFFEALFWIVLLLTVIFRSLRWALVAAIPNIVPPTFLLGFLAVFDIPVKPGIAIIFAISLGLAFCNTVYVLDRLRHLLKSRDFKSTLPIYTLMKLEAMPCLVSSLSLFAGFSIFLFSVFPVNKLFGVFMLISVAAGLLGDLVWLPAILKRYPWLLLEKGDDVMKTVSLPWQRVARVSPYVILIMLGLVAFRSAYAAGTTVQEILDKVSASSQPPNERNDIKMVIQEADGSKKERVLTILRKTEKDTRALIRLQKPSDLRGLTLLTVASEGKEDQWLYLPSDKKSRRIVGSNKKGKFLDSEIAYEDLSLETYKGFDNKVAKETAKVIQIDSRAKPDSDSSYGRIVTWVAKPDMRLEKVDYYDKSGKLLKRAQFSKYEKVGDKFWRARLVSVTNVQDKRKTSLTVQKVSLKKISDDEVSLSALED